MSLFCDLYYVNAITLTLACFSHMITIIIVLLNICKTDYTAHTLYKALLLCIPLV